jgi:predicted transcriptional regulator
MGKKTWNELKREHFTDEEVEQIRVEAAMELAELRLGELRQKLGITQIEMAERMEAAQPYLSKIENSEDFYLSTLKRYIRALGGRLEIHAVVDDEQVILRV